jgi:glycosyltransferase involved in cell wall biosynthesis
VPMIIGHVQEIWTDSDRRVLVPVLRACHRLIAISDAVAAATSASLRPRMVVVPNATPEPDGATPLEGRDGPLVFVVASRWNGWKGHATLLTAWDRLQEGRLLVLGGPPLSGDRCDVPALVDRLLRPESVEIVGEVADAGPYLAQADVVVVPSDAPEPFGLIAIEAFARGRPVVASAGGGLLDIVEDERNGWLFEPANAAALAGVLAKLTRPAVTAAGRNARKSYESHYTTPEYATRWRAAVGFEGGTTEK